MKTADILIYRLNDWEGLYINGELQRQNHSLDGWEILTDLIDYKISSVVYEYSEWEMWELYGSLPKYLSEIPDEALENSKNKELILSYRNGK